MIVVAAVGIILCIYTYWMMTEYGKHIRTAWNRTDYLSTQIPGLEEVWQAGYVRDEKNDEDDEVEGKTSIPKFVRRLRYLCWLFGVAFLGAFILAIAQ